MGRGRPSDHEVLGNNIADHLFVIAQEHPNMLAVVFPEGRDSRGRVSYTHYTYKQLAARAEVLALGFQRAGIGAGCRTVLMAKPSLDFFAVTFALFRAGAVPVLIDPGVGIPRIKRCIEEAEPEAFVGITKAHVARVVLGWNRGRFRKLVSVDGKTALAQHDLQGIERLGAEERGDALPNVAPEDPAAVLFTSGSTGSPKGALYSHKNFNAQVELLKAAYGIAHGEIDLCTFPLFALFAPALGMTAIVPDMDFTKPGQVNAERLFEAMENFGVTNMFGSPALIKRLAAACIVEPEKSRDCLGSMRRLISAGAPVPYQTLAELKKHLPENAEIHTPYGATEALPVATIESREILGRTAEVTARGDGVCVGRPVPGIAVRIIEITDAPILQWSDSLMVPPGKIGEVTVSGPQVTEAYLNRPAANEKAKIRDLDGSIIHRMGDVGYFDEEGRLWFCGRKTHRVAAEQGDMYTVPCETLFNTHEDVARTALVGVGKAQSAQGRGEKPVLCVEVLPTSREVDKSRLRQELLTLAKTKPHTKDIETVLFHRRFPVDIRHNSKIFREKLKVWAEKKVRH